ncbi:MAG: hypothetical protein AAF399_13805 [Bacteroidota bacterium]
MPSVDSPEAAPTRYSISQEGGNYTLLTPAGEAFFPIGMNHLNIHELQSVRPELQGLDEVELNQALYDSLQQWGFNCSGYDRVEGLNSRFDMYHYIKLELLYLASYHGKPEFLDVFDRTTEDQLGQAIQSLARYNEDPNVLGLMYSDIPMFVPTAQKN